MEKTRPILYGVSDYAQMRKANAWFVDRTAKIRDLEATRYALFLRPRRFGKSLWASILEAYYDVRYADRFDEFFSGTDIGENPTDERGKYLILRFDFSAVSKDAALVQDDFNGYAGLRCDTFARDYAQLIPGDLAERIFKAPTVGKKLNEIASGLQHTDRKLYIIIDEYDNFTNTILAEYGVDAYNRLCHGDGFFKDFFTRLKAATSGTEAPVARLFITGVSPVTMDDVTSGFNIGTNISLDPRFADLTGFRHDDLRAIADYYAPRCGFDADKAYNVALAWYDNYRFGSADAPALANTTLVLSLFNMLWQTGRFPDDFIDENLRTDYAKIRYLVAADRRLNGNFHVLETLLAGGLLSERLVKSFQAKELSQKENFTSLLYWLGITTITGAKFGKTAFGVPNETLKELAAKMIPAAYADVHKIDERVFGINDGLCEFAENGDWRGFVGILSEIVKENFAVRDSVEGEKVVQATLVALLIAAGGPYFVRHEREAGGGFYDIALVPQLDRWPDIAHAALIEMKYVKAGDPAPTAEALADIKAQAIEQLDKYSHDHDIAMEWHVGASRTPRPTTGATGVPSVELHRLVLVFHGGDALLAEEVWP
ncbi:MAG: AAA family ATPase [Kiritimatiellae bacterium]|nr:AAA family ATPase [Kiritimatiellia bacterium]MBR0506416.1 AAA family ATPase [Kiritimatiellia bacterium]